MMTYENFLLIDPESFKSLRYQISQDKPIIITNVPKEIDPSLTEFFNMSHTFNRLGEGETLKYTVKGNTYTFSNKFKCILINNLD